MPLLSEKSLVKNLYSAPSCLILTTQRLSPCLSFNSRFIVKYLYLTVDISVIDICCTGKILRPASISIPNQKTFSFLITVLIKCFELQCFAHPIHEQSAILQLQDVVFFLFNTATFLQKFFLILFRIKI